MDVILVSTFGVLRGINLIERHATSYDSAIEGNVKCACWGSTQDEIFLGGDSGIVSKQVLDNRSANEFMKCESAVVSLCSISENSSLLSAESSGCIRVSSTPDGISLVNISCAPQLHAAKVFQPWVAAGGRNSNLSIWDLNNSSQPVFLAKNVRATTLDLEVPVWISDISFVPRQNGRILVTGSRTGEFNLYDRRCNQRRPVSRHAWRASRKHGKIKVGRGTHGAVLPDLAVTRPITKVVAFDDAPGVGIRAVAGNSIGDLCFLDFRLPSLVLRDTSDVDHTNNDLPTPTAPHVPVKSRGSRAAEPPFRVNSLQPACGAITGLACSGADEANSPVLAWSSDSSHGDSYFNKQRVVVACSLDRFLRVYDRDSGDRLTKFYGKIPIVSMLIQNRASFEALLQTSNETEGDVQGVAAENDAESVVTSEDELWDQMEQITDDNVSVKHTTKRKRV